MALVGRRPLAAVAGMLVLASSACGGPVNSSAEESSQTNDVAQRVGKAVTISAAVTEVITPLSFVLDASEEGDGTLLVITNRPLPRLKAGDKLIVSGRVATFQHARYRGDYALGGPVAYQPFQGEPFLIGDGIAVTKGS